MKLSRKERSIARQQRGSTNLRHIHHTGDHKIDLVIDSIVKQYVNDCTISFNEITIAENSPMSKESLLKYLITHLKKYGNEFQRYFDDPDMLFRHLAYLVTSTSMSFENFFKLTLRLKETDTLECACESVFLLTRKPNLTKRSLEDILPYRIGISDSTVHKVLNSKIGELFDPKVQDYLKHFDLEKDNTLFDLCKKRAAFLSDNRYC